MASQSAFGSKVLANSRVGRNTLRAEMSSLRTRFDYFSTAIGFAALAVGASAQNGTIRTLLVLAALVMAVPSILRIWRARRPAPIGHEVALVSPGAEGELIDRVQIFQLVLPTDVLRFRNFAVSFFGEDECWPQAQYMQMFRRFSNAMTIAVDSETNRIVGGLGIWPLTRKAYDGLRTGLIAEEELESKDVNTSEPKTHWYIADVAADPTWRSKFPALVPSILQLAIENWRENSAGSEELHLLAHAYSECGSKLASRLGMALVHTGNHESWALEGESEAVRMRILTSFDDYESARLTRGTSNTEVRKAA